MFTPKSTLENDIKFSRDFEKQMDHLFAVKRPDVELINKKELAV